MAKTKTRKLYLKDNIVKILLLIIVVWFFGMLAVNQMRSNLIQTEEIKTTLLEQVDSGYGLLSGPETALLAPADGDLVPTMPEGTRVRKGNAVFSVNGSIVYASEAGYVSYQIDGLEGITDLNAICSTDLAARYAAQQEQEEAASAAVVGGAVCAKLVNTFDDSYLYVTAERTDYIASIEVDQKIPVRLVDLDYEVQAKVSEVLDAADGARYLKLKVSDVKETVFQQRIYKVELPYDRLSAIAVPVGALVEKDGQQGVYYLQKGFVFWNPVTVGQTREEEGLVIIEEGLENGDMIVTTPHLVREGENIKF